MLSVLPFQPIFHLCEFFVRFVIFVVKVSWTTGLDLTQKPPPQRHKAYKVHTKNEKRIVSPWRKHRQPLVTAKCLWTAIESS